MRRSHGIVAIAVAAVGVLGVGAVAAANTASDGSGRSVREALTSFEEVPALSSPGTGEFRATINNRGESIEYRLSFNGLETAVTQAHIHFENRTENGPIVVFLCTNLGNGPAGTQTCPAAGGEIRGTIRPADVGAGAAAQGLNAGEFQEFVRALRNGATYVNVHSMGRPTGEIRAQLNEGPAR